MRLSDEILEQTSPATYFLVKIRAGALRASAGLLRIVENSHEVQNNVVFRIIRYMKHPEIV